MTEDSTDFVGTLEAKDQVSVVPQTGGRIVQILVKAGTLVKPNAPLFQLDSREQSGIFSDTAVTTAKAQLQAAEAAKEKAEAQLSLASIEAKRYIFLQQQGAVSAESRDQKIRALDASKATLKVAENEYKAAQNQVQQTIATAGTAPDQITATGVQVSDAKIVAPIAGIVGNISYKVGDYINTGTVLTTITRNTELNLTTNIPTIHLPKLRPRLSVKLLDPKEDKIIGSGRISFISPNIDQANQVVLTKFTFPNDGSLRNGQLVRAKVIWQRKPGILIPKMAVSSIAGQNFVYVTQKQDQDGRSQQVALQKRVQLGDSQGQSYQVLSGLEEGETLITSGILNLSDGTPITPKSSASKTSTLNSSAPDER